MSADYVRIGLSPRNSVRVFYGEDFTQSVLVVDPYGNLLVGAVALYALLKGSLRELRDEVLVVRFNHRKKAIRNILML